MDDLDDSNLYGAGDGLPHGIPVFAPPAVLPPMPPRPQRTRRRRAERPLYLDNLPPHERVMEATLLMLGGEWSGWPRALVSTDWSQSGIAAAVAESLGHPIDTLPGGQTNTFQSSRGRITYHRVVLLWFYLSDLDVYPSLVWLPVLEHEPYSHLGISMVIGRPFIEACFGQAWPPPPPAHHMLTF
ncbi:hypothetical protein C8A01DRAFT_32765 [Parachaetomium inaequale]|uniref:Uncharacterized protein n=1 Tax=Parachaetomium inaequale TaxID=2588326 RepID=A0AAN6PNI7_9PEZI|nr:hypothetical protein C8A01DRAFT_32765 [Parachaetomium inaequale]